MIGKQNGGGVLCWTLSYHSLINDYHLLECFRYRKISLISLWVDGEQEKLNKKRKLTPYWEVTGHSDTHRYTQAQCVWMCVCVHECVCKPPFLPPKRRCCKIASVSTLTRRLFVFAGPQLVPYGADRLGHGDKRIFWMLASGTVSKNLGKV